MKTGDLHRKKQGDDKRYYTQQIAKDIWLSEKYMEYKASGHLSFLFTGNQCNPKQTWRIVHDLGIVYKQPKLEMEKEKDDDYEE